MDKYLSSVLQNLYLKVSFVTGFHLGGGLIIQAVARSFTFDIPVLRAPKVPDFVGFLAFCTSNRHLPMLFQKYILSF